MNRSRKTPDEMSTEYRIQLFQIPKTFHHGARFVKKPRYSVSLHSTHFTSFRTQKRHLRLPLQEKRQRQLVATF